MNEDKVVRILIKRDNGQIVNIEDATDEEVLEALKQVNAELEKTRCK